MYLLWHGLFHQPQSLQEVPSNTCCVMDIAMSALRYSHKALATTTARCVCCGTLLHNVSGTLVPVLSQLHSKEVLSDVQMEPLVFWVVPIDSCPGSGHH